MKLRRYVAVYDDGHDFGEFEFWSYHRAGSKENIKDGYKEAARKFGSKRCWKITITYVGLRD